MPLPLTDKQEQLLDHLYFNDKLVFGLGRDRVFKYLQEHHPEVDISRRQVDQWLKENEVNQLFRKRNPKKDIARTVVSAPHKLIEIDLVDMSSKADGDYKWLLNGIDVFTKKAYTVPLFNKEEGTVLEGIKKMIAGMKQKPSTIRSDNGSEFINDAIVDWAEKEDITLVNGKPGTPQSQGNVERFNGVLKRLIEMYKTQFDKYDWHTYVQKLVDGYNRTWQRAIDKSPDEAEGGNAYDHEVVKANILKSITPKNGDDMDMRRYRKGDKVRLLLEPESEIGGKSFRNWSDEIYTIDKVIKPRGGNVFSVYYKILDPDGKLVNEKFYQSELQGIEEVQKEIEQPARYKVSSLVRPVMRGGVRSYEVKWTNYRKAKDNTIEPREKLMEDVPKMVEKYEEEHKVKWYATTVKYNKKAAQS